MMRLPACWRDPEILVKKAMYVAKKATMIIVDDVEINRVILTQFFKEDYTVLEACNGREALQIIENQPVDIILLDRVMPVMDGFELLALLKKNEKYVNIPVVVMTARNEGDSEIRAMEMGAADFIKKPYNPTIVCCRIRNVMARIENEWRKLEQKKKEQEIVAMHHYIEHDALTGIYNRETFYGKASSLMQENPETVYDIIYLDISCFKVINDLFHVETGNLLLKTAAVYFDTYTNGGGLCGRLEADHFALCMPRDAVHMEHLICGLDSAMESLNICHAVLFYAGVYPVDNVFLPVDQMCDRAHMALNTVKGKYKPRFAYYDENMRELLLEEQTILRDMDYALAEEQFCIYLQPIYSLHSEKIVGAEALVRWKHPTKGMLAPGRYIPLFERNGFIVQLDHFVWECACKFLCTQRRMGTEIIPVSVNVSRINFYNDDLFETIVHLLKKYELEPWMLKLEITESAYTSNPHKVLEVMAKLQDYGIQVLMDDFGSGYSSLNMLKNVMVDILKIDMNFVKELETSARAVAIVQAIVKLAENIDMGVIVEGVETRSQMEMLKTLGCDRMQGYYFSKPVEEEQFRALLKDGAGISFG